MIPWVPEAFQEPFPDSVKLKSVCSCLRPKADEAPCRTREKNLWYPEKADEETES